MSKLYKPTRITREALVQEWRVFLEPEQDAPLGSLRRVHVVAPPSPSVFVLSDRDPKELGLDRTYKGAPLASGLPLRFELLPEQYLVGAVGDGFGAITLVVEYLRGH